MYAHGVKLLKKTFVYVDSFVNQLFKVTVSLNKCESRKF